MGLNLSTWKKADILATQLHFQWMKCLGYVVNPLLGDIKVCNDSSLRERQSAMKSSLVLICLPRQNKHEESKSPSTHKLKERKFFRWLLLEVQGESLHSIDTHEKIVFAADSVPGDASKHVMNVNIDPPSKSQSGSEV